MERGVESFHPRKLKKFHTPIWNFLNSFYFMRAIQFTGHSPAQALQSIQAPSSMTLFPLAVSEIQSTGHRGSQAPHATHRSKSIL